MDGLCLTEMDGGAIAQNSQMPSHDQDMSRIALDSDLQLTSKDEIGVQSSSNTISTPASRANWIARSS